MMKFNPDQIEKPALVLDEVKARRNIRNMAEKTAAQGIRFRPHFKTHQSAQVGEWFREEGVKSITVSSLSMARYFAEHGWQDILVAFPANLREIRTINDLAKQVKLGLLVESSDVAEELDQSLKAPVDIWVKIDTGYHRTGIDCVNIEAILALIRKIKQSGNLNLRGLLTHAGQTYHADSPEEITALYTESCRALLDLKMKLEKAGIVNLALSVGDTPGCWLSEDLGEVDEIRPGNFIFFDAMMMDFGVCGADDIALAVACPVVALHPERNEAVIYGGAVHLSKDVIQKKYRSIYGYIAFSYENGWRISGLESYVKSLSQEHGVVYLSENDFERLEIGDLLYVIPVHSCLTASCLNNNYHIIA